MATVRPPGTTTRFMTTPWPRRVAAAVAVLAAVLAPLATHWVAGRTLVAFDTQILYAPQRWIVEEALRGFRLPLWNPYMGTGTPLLADAIHGVLHPISILTAWVGSDRSADLLIGGYVACAGLGAALLARELGASPVAGAAAGAMFGTSGFVLSMAGNLVFLAGAASLPLALAGLRRFAANPGPGSLALGVGGVAVLALSGDAQALMVGGALALALAWEAGGRRGVARAATAGLVGLLVGAVQLLPSAVHLPRTLRAAETWQRTPLAWALAPWRLPELVLPGISFGPHPFNDPVFEGLAGPGRWPAGNLPHPFVQSIFLGLVPMALAAAAVRDGRRGRLLGLLALVLLWAAFGPTLGADAVLGRVPVWGSLRYAEKLVGPLTLLLAALAGLGVDAVAERRVSARWVLVAAAALALTAVGALHLGASGLAPEARLVAESRALRGAGHVLGAALGLLAFLLLRHRLGGGWARVGLAVLAWGGVVAASGLALRPGDPASRLRSPGPALDAEPPGARIVVPYLRDPTSTAPGLDWLDQGGRQQAPLGYHAYHARSRLDSINVYAAMFPRRLALLEEAYWPRWSVAARRYAVTHVILEPPETEDQRQVHALATEGATPVEPAPAAGQAWAVPHEAWARFPLRVRAVKDPQAALLQVTRSFTEHDDTVGVETWGQVQAAPGRVLSIDRRPEWLRVEAEAEGNATLVIADAWWPGWEATIDGATVQVLAADVLVRAVRWPAGRHVLEMRYRPPEVATGLLLSGLGLALLAAWAVVLRRRPTPALGAPPSGR